MAAPDGVTGGGAWPALLCPACRSALKQDGGGASCSGCGAFYSRSHDILHLVAGAAGPPGYDPHYFATLPSVEETHFWFVARRQVILQGLRSAVPDWRRRPLFDIGCGSGGLLSFLASAGVPVAGGCDAYLLGLEHARKRVSAPLVLVDEGRLPPLASGRAMIGLFDVLEHLDDDRGVLAWIHGVLEPGGVLVLTVPAHPFLFDEMDAIAHHRRRYRRSELRAKLESAGFEVRLLTHFMASLVPLLAVLRPVARLRKSSSAHARRDLELRVLPGVNALGRGLLAMERLLARFLSLPFGTSLLAIASRPPARDNSHGV